MVELRSSEGCGERGDCANSFDQDWEICTLGLHNSMIDSILFTGAESSQGSVRFGLTAVWTSVMLGLGV